jgi:hypothetical protein
MRLTLLIAALSLLAAGPIAAKPSPEEAERIIDYYFNGKADGPLLVSAKVCADVHAEGNLKNECTREFIDNKVSLGQPFYLWMKYVVPVDSPPTNILVQLNYQGITLQTVDVSVSPSIRYRTWRRVALDKPGTWEVKILHDRGDRLEVLGETAVNVAPAAQ